MCNIEHVNDILRHNMHNECLFCLEAMIDTGSVLTRLRQKFVKERRRTMA